MTATDSTPTTTDTPDRLDGPGLVAMFVAASAALQRNIEPINALNVFPVPDGDTGTNMYLTMQSGIDDLKALTAPTVSEVASAFYSGTFLGARGNSGVILSQFFKGFSEGLDGRDDCGDDDLARACDLARVHAYKSVANPVEGTMLTVIASVADATREAAAEGNAVPTVLRIASDRAAETVAKTTEMLPVLQEAGVVDAGGQGLAVIIEGMRRSAAGEDITEAAFDIQVPDVAPSASARVSDDFFEAHAEDEYGYCTQFVVEAEGLDVDDLRVVMNDIAGSTVVIGDGSRAMVHGHAEDPGSLISMGISIGALSKVKIENMDAQHTEFASDRSQVQPEPELPGGVAVIAVAWGEGIEEVFRDTGATHLVTGGNTMNPSVRDLMDAIDRAAADTAYLLPNNKNIVPAARQAAEQSSKSVHVIETVSIPQGIAALFDFNPEVEADENVGSMEDARQEVTTGEITRAARDATIEGVEVREGQFLALLDGKPRGSGDDLNPVLVDLVGQADLQPGGLVTLYWGDMLSSDDAASASHALQQVYDDLEVDVHHGGQPHYEFIISIE
ncbi:MAG: DAK2 domain-containing protein [Chloroflexi bacterium]|nr:DAK2 domain-containing protein [Chloroflexota bacterium]